MSAADMLADFILVMLLGLTLGGGIGIAVMLARLFCGRR